MSTKRQQRQAELKKGYALILMNKDWEQTGKVRGSWGLYDTIGEIKALADGLLIAEYLSDHPDRDIMVIIEGNADDNENRTMEGKTIMRGKLVDGTIEWRKAK